jgi:hypothetical protein
MRPSSATKRDAAAAAALAVVLAAALYPRALLRGEAFFERDLHLDWYPRIAAITASLRAGAWPLWDPGVAFGQPLLADPGAQVAYPLTWLVLLATPAAAYTVYVVAHLALTAAGAFLAGRAVGGTRPGAAVAAALWVLCGPLQSAVNLWHHFAGVCWMPWVLLAAQRLARRPGARAVIALGAAGGLQALAGSADVCALSWSLVLPWIVLRAPPGRRTAAAAAGACGLVLAAGISAVVWWPAAELVARSQRSALPAGVRTAWSVPLAGLLRLVVPLDPARVAFSTEVWEALYDRASTPLLYSLYLGVPAVALAVASLADRRRRRPAALLVAGAAVAVAFALGPHGPVYPAVAALLPPVRIFRYPSKALFLGAFAACLAAGLGVSALARGRTRRSGVLGGAILVALLAAIAASRRFDPVLGWTGALAAAPALPLLLRSIGRVRAPVAAAGAGALAAAGLLVAHADLNATAPADLLFTPPALVSRVDRREGRRLYVYDYSLPGAASRLLGRSDPFPALSGVAVDPRLLRLMALREYLPPPGAALFGLEGSYDVDIRGLYPAPLRELVLFLRAVEGTPAHLKMLRMGAVGTVASLHTAGLEGLILRETLPSLFPEPIRVWSVPDSLPRAWVVGCSRVADGARAFAAIVDPGFDPSREVILAAGPSRPEGCGSPGESRRLWAPPDRVRVRVRLSRPGFLVVADAWDPGWRAGVDGASVPVLRANVAFRAIALPAGEHDVEMVYRPRSAAAGLLVSVGTIVLAAAGALLLRDPSRRPRSARPPPPSSAG